MATNCPKLRQLISDIRTLQSQLDSGLLTLPDNLRQGRQSMNELWQIKERLEAKVAEFKSETDPYKDWQTYENGEKILHYQGSYGFWHPQPQGGIVIEKRIKKINLGEEDEIIPQFLLNGQKELQEGDPIRFEQSLLPQEGYVIERITKKDDKAVGQLLLNGRFVLYKGDWDDWQPHPQGVIIRKGNQFLLNGKDLLYDGDFRDWCPYPHGVIIHKDYDWYFYNQAQEKKK